MGTYLSVQIDIDIIDIKDLILLIYLSPKHFMTIIAWFYYFVELLFILF